MLRAIYETYCRWQFTRYQHRFLRWIAREKPKLPHLDAVSPYNIESAAWILMQKFDPKVNVLLATVKSLITTEMLEQGYQHKNEAIKVKIDAPYHFARPPKKPTLVKNQT